MAGAFAGEAKTDARGARTIAETARLRADLSAVAGADPLVGELRVLAARRADVMADRVGGINRLRGLPSSIFPALERAFEDSTRSALLLLTGFPTPTGLRSAGRDGVGEYPRVHGGWARGIPAMAERALAGAAEQTIVPPTEAATAPLIARLAARLLHLDREIKDLDAQIADRFAEHPDALSATRRDNLSRAFYQRKRAEDKRHTQALITPARRLIDLTRALLHDKRVFTPTAPHPANAA